MRTEMLRRCWTARRMHAAACTTRRRRPMPEACLGIGEPPVSSRSALGLKELHRVARRIVEQNLIAANAVDDLVPKVDALLLEAIDHRRQVVDFDLEAVPSARCGARTVGHGARASPFADGSAEQETEIAAQ